MSGLRVIRAEGDGYARGLAIGRALSSAIRVSVDYNFAHFARRGLGRSDIERLAGPLLAATERRLPSELAALRGMADGAGLSVLEVLVPNAYEELDPWADPAWPTGSGQERRAIERCTAVAVVGPGVTLLGHDEQWLAGEPGEIVVIVEVPDDPAEPAVVSPTVASWRPAVGWNATCHAQGVMSLSATNDRPGIPRVFVSRATLGAVDRADAIARATPPDRSGGYGYVHAFRGGEAFMVETSATDVAVVEEPMAHTNHYLDGELARAAPGGSAGSVARHDRAANLLTSAEIATPEGVQAILADHRSVPSTICLHPDPADGDDAEAVLFSMVCDLEAGRMWVAPGRPCETPYEVFELAELVAG